MRETMTLRAPTLFLTIVLLASPALAADPGLAALGVEVLSFSVLAIKPTPETSKALEAEARERLLRESPATGG